jgi:hypothetical protein
MKKDFHTFKFKWENCQQYKGETIKPLGPSQLLPILAIGWTNIYLYFNVGLLKEIIKLVVIVVVDILAK